MCFLLGMDRLSLFGNNYYIKRIREDSCNETLPGFWIGCFLSVRIYIRV